MDTLQYTHINHYAFLIPEDKEWFTAKEVAALIGRTSQYVRDAFENQKILGHILNGKARRGNERRRSYQIHRDAVLLFLLETANYDPEDFIVHVKHLLKNRTQEQLVDIQAYLNSLLEDNHQHSPKKIAV